MQRLKEHQEKAQQEWFKDIPAEAFSKDSPAGKKPKVNKRGEVEPSSSSPQDVKKAQQIKDEVEKERLGKIRLHNSYLKKPRLGRKLAAAGYDMQPLPFNASISVADAKLAMIDECLSGGGGDQLALFVVKGVNKAASTMQPILGARTPAPNGGVIPSLDDIFDMEMSKDPDQESMLAEGMEELSLKLEPWNPTTGAWGRIAKGYLGFLYTVWDVKKKGVQFGGREEEAEELRKQSEDL